MKRASEKLKSVDKNLEGLILLNHGIFTFGDTAKESYERMINIVNEANNFLSRKVNLRIKQDLDKQSLGNQEISLLPYIRGIMRTQIL